MKITREAHEKLREFLEDYGDGGFVRVSRLVTGGGCCAKLSLGVGLDEERNEEEDLLFTIDGLPVVIGKSLYAVIPELEIAFDEERGIVVSGKSAVEA
jgi:Fe-S cluster assembly iron-binding protein IscA